MKKSFTGAPATKLVGVPKNERSVRSDPHIARRLGDGLGNHAVWRKTMPSVLAQKYPKVYQEFLVEPVVETIAAQEERLAHEYPMEVLKDQLTPLIPDAAYNEIQALPAGQRGRATDVAMAALKLQAREENAQIESSRLVRITRIREHISLAQEQEFERLAMAAAVLDLYTHPDLRAEVIVHADFNKAPGAFNSANRVCRIIGKLLAGAGSDFNRVADANDKLTGLRQKSEYLHQFTTVFCELKARCEELESALTEAQYCQYYVRALSVGVFKDFKLAYRVPEPPAVADLDALINVVADWYTEQVGVDASVAGLLTGAMSKDFMAFAVQVMDIEDCTAEVVTTVEESRSQCKCQICKRAGHDASKCWDLLDPEVVKELVSKVKVRNPSNK